MTHFNARRLGAAALSALTALCLALPARPARADAQPPQKEEVVYASLSASGTVMDAYVVNIFNLPQAGTITDYGDYESVVNLTSTQPLTRNGIETTVQAEAGRFYYQGNLNARLLPWNFTIGYTLNGKAIQPEDLGGQSGALSIRIQSAKNGSVDAGFYDNYMLQLSVTLDAQKCTGIQAEGATLANAGANKMLTFTVMPGSDGDVTVQADVVSFEMPGISINAVPLSIKIEAPDTQGLLGDINELADAIGMVNEGVTDLTNGIDELKTGAYSLKKGVNSFGDGLSSLSSGGAALSKGSSDFNSALSSFASGLSGAGGGAGGLGNISALTGGLTSLSGQLRGTATSVSGLETNVKGVASALNALPAPGAAPGAAPDLATETGDRQALIDQYDSLKSQYNSLLASYNGVAGSVNTAKGLAGSLDGIATGLNGVAEGLTTMADTLDSIASQLGSALSQAGIDAMMAQLQGAANGLASAYTDLNSSIDQYTYGVYELNRNYSGIRSGMSGVYNGISQLFGGAEELSGGTEELEDQTSGMDEQVNDAIDEILSDYDRSDYQPNSFVSIRNKNVVSVQFVIQAQGVQLPEAQPEAPEAEPETGFWDKLWKLFE